MYIYLVPVYFIFFVRNILCYNHCNYFYFFFFTVFLLVLIVVLAQVLFHVSRFLKLYVNFLRNCELCHVLTNTPLLVLIQPDLQTNQGRGRTLCDAWHFFCVWIIHQKVTSHPVNKRVEWQKKFDCDIIVLPVSKTAIFRNRRDISSVLFGHDKQNFVFFLAISFVCGTEQLFVQKDAVLKACVFTKFRRFFVTEFHRSHRLRVNNEF